MFREQLTIDGVEGTRVGRYGKAVNTTFMIYRIGDTWVDSGPPNQWRYVRRLAERTRPRQILLTHHHEDHSGNAQRIAEHYGSALLAPAKTLPLVAGGFKIEPYRRLVWGVPPKTHAQPLPETVELAGDVQLRVVEAPGHASDMVCLFEERRGWLFSADLYVGSTLRYLRSDEEFPLLLASLRRLCALDFELLFCPHRGIVHGGKAALCKKRDSLEQLAERAQQAQRQGHDSRAISRALLGPEDGFTLFSLGDFSKENLIKGCLRAVL